MLIFLSNNLIYRIDPYWLPAFVISYPEVLLQQSYINIYVYCLFEQFFHELLRMKFLPVWQVSMG
jgi:hypothetical protein